MPIGVTFRGMMAAAGETPFTPDAAVSDPDNDSCMLRGGDWTGAVDGSNGLFSCWVRFNGGDGGYHYLLSDVGYRLYVCKDTDNRLYIYTRTSGSAALVTLRSNSTLTADATWHHICGSWNGTVCHLWIDGLQDEDIASINAGTCDHTVADHGLLGTVTKSSIVDADVAELYLALEYLDISDASELEKFRSSGGEAVDLGADGSTPTGNQPIVYCHLPDGGTADTEFNNQNGSGGAFTVFGSLGETDGPNG